MDHRAGFQVQADQPVDHRSGFQVQADHRMAFPAAVVPMSRLPDLVRLAASQVERLQGGVARRRRVRSVCLPARVAPIRISESVIPATLAHLRMDFPVPQALPLAAPESQALPAAPPDSLALQVALPVAPPDSRVLQVLARRPRRRNWRQKHWRNSRCS